ncbi:MAG: hypothetical protein IR164_07960 [Devosia sp.]|uniref:hypothetical protein n=1 Tax=unclassified Devosia TaxID=196773 RepID=UPI001A0627CE|nr:MULTISPECIES: hypothetical protein [unclassified Devosia]MBF0678858.1 hypothetical protein [Devosia sp.]WEJ32777.1 hypothetical protein NYQ88_18140 [Devosia sp. SD17-2]
MEGSVRRKRRISLTAFLSFVILTALAPPLLLLALVVFRTAETDRAAALTILVDNSKVIASMVHGALVSDVEVLKTVGSHVNELHTDLESELDLIT